MPLRIRPYGAVRYVLLAVLWVLCTPAFAPSDAAVVTREVVFGPGRRISGQLDKPPGAGPFPLVILIPAGGRLDRNGTSPSLTAFKDVYVPLVGIAVRAGWAIFRYDRQGAGSSRPSERDEAIDALDVVRIARELPDVDPRRVVIIAHASGTEILQSGYDYFEERIGFHALKGVILLSSDVGSQSAGRMAGNLLVIIGESDGTERSSIAGGAVSVHRRDYPDRQAEAMVVPRADHALCDTTVAGWSGWAGDPGSCVISRQVYDAIDRFLRQIHSPATARRAP